MGSALPRPAAELPQRTNRPQAPTASPLTATYPPRLDSIPRAPAAIVRANRRGSCELVAGRVELTSCQRLLTMASARGAAPTAVVARLLGRKP